MATQRSSMTLDEYHRTIQVPAYTAMEAVRRAGLRVSETRIKAQMEAWETELLDIQKEIEDLGASKGFQFKYSEKHSPQPQGVFSDFLFSPRGLGLEIYKTSDKTKKPSTDDESLLPYAAIGSNHNRKDGEPFEDHPVVYKILRIRSIGKARGTHLNGLLKFRRSDGCVHAKFNWNNPNTTRLSAEDPPLQQLPERADPEIAKKVKTCIIPRLEPWLGDPAEWDPRKHGWCAKVDVKGAEAVVRAGCLAKCRVSVPYLRAGKDIHSRTASVLYAVPEGTYKKGTYQRDSVGKTAYFLLLFGGSPKALRLTILKEARIFWDEETAQEKHKLFFSGYRDLKTRYDVDTEIMFRRGYIEDSYGRRWTLPAPPGVTYSGGRIHYPSGLPKEALQLLRSKVAALQHRYANRGTQCNQGTTTLWGIALAYHGEYVDLRVPEIWEDSGLVFPEVAGYELNGGMGPGGKPFQAWMNNTVHDSTWLDGGPGTLEPAMKVMTRRFNGVPAPFLLEANMPWRVEAEVGPDFGHLETYEKVAAKFGLEPMPDR